ncbi:MAG TPA: hybrid sensor histidine kinase/response regulator [Exilispira sp.]|nr:hybrid sensor histidine kinase/response regulator [Spirochaetota bacterium]HNV43117.1 hybrid sensor histidine kinase/response regulator [Exilispira sp.]HOV46237.1 hybrid sensor histidine kinase/response regulator [Exilispira sp.]
MSGKIDNKVKILYIEDNQYNLLLVKKILLANGYEFYEAKTGFEGIDIAQKIFPDLILMDINLPDLSGFDVTTKIRSIPSLNNVKIIAITAEIGEGARGKAIASGCDGYIPKPIDTNFPNKIKEFLYGKMEKIDKDSEVKYLRQYSKELIDKLLAKYSELEKSNEDLENTLNIIKEVNQKLILLNKMEENFIAISSHELRTPVVVIKGFIDLIGDGAFGELNPKLLEIIKILQVNINRLITMIEDITSYANLKDNQTITLLSEVNIVELLKSIFDEFQVKFAERKLVANFESYVQNPYTSVEVTLFSQAIRNIIANAIKYTADLGTITAGIIEETDQYKIYVRDNGIGIEKEYLERVFEKFFTIQDSSHYFSGDFEFMAGGKGLGLSIVKSIARIHQGKVWAESEGKNKGSTFYFTIPKNVKEKMQKSLSLNKHNRKVYVIGWKDALDFVDMNIYDLEIMSVPDFLMKCDALPPPSIYIIYIGDVNEDLTVDIISRLKTFEKSKEVPIIIIDKQPDHHMKAKLYSLGIEEYISEPINKDQFKNIFEMFVI